MSSWALCPGRAGPGGHLAHRHDTVRMAKALMRTALADKLGQARPALGSVRGSSRPARRPGRIADYHAVRRITGNGKERKAAAWVAAAVLAVALWGGYTRGWQWTGFRGNNQLWDWLTLLLLPVALGHYPAVDPRTRNIFGKGGRIIYAAAIAAWAGLVTIGSLIPLNSTGSRPDALGLA